MHIFISVYFLCEYKFHVDYFQQHYLVKVYPYFSYYFIVGLTTNRRQQRINVPSGIDGLKVLPPHGVWVIETNTTPPKIGTVATYNETISPSRVCSQEDHPRPGRPYAAFNFVSYIPNSDEGKTVARLLKRAFDQKLLFAFEETEGDADLVMPRDCVRHRTKTSGGPAL